MKKILIFVDSFLPGFKGGGPVTSIANLNTLINDTFDILICTRNCDFGDKIPYEHIESNKIVVYKNFKVIYLEAINISSISKISNEFKPDLFYLSSFFSKTTQLVMLYNKFFYKTNIIISPRGELQKNALEIKKNKKLIYLYFYKLFKFYKNINFHSTDIIETNDIKSLFKINNISQISNIAKIYNFDPLLKKKDELKIIFVSRISRKKNLHFALNILNNIKYNIIFDIYGPKEDLSYWQECEKIISLLPNNIKVSYKGSLPQDEIVYKMREYHAFLLPTLSENFGHVIVESMQAGLIPIISDQTPWLDLENINVGWSLSLEDSDKFILAIKILYEMSDTEYKEISYSVMKYINKKTNLYTLKNEYINFFNKIMEEKDV